jgi:rRNA-processing protein FCF1
MAELLLDSSFLIFLVTTPSAGLGEVQDILGRVNQVVLDSVVVELRKIVDRGSAKRSRAAANALAYASKLRQVQYDEGGSVDDQILGYAVSHDVAVATLDADLRRRLRSAGVVVVIPRSDRLVVEGR